jgi:hypothetical protein
LHVSRFFDQASHYPFALQHAFAVRPVDFDAYPENIGEGVFRLQNVPNTEEMNFDSGAQNALVGRIRLGEPLPAYTIGLSTIRMDPRGIVFDSIRLSEFIQSPFADIPTCPGGFAAVNPIDSSRM